MQGEDQKEFKIVTNRRAHEPEDFVSYRVHMPFDSALGSTHSPDTQHYCLQQYTSASAAIPQLYGALRGPRCG